MSNLRASDSRPYKIEHLCTLLGVSKQAYYKRNENHVLERAAREALALQCIRDIRMKDPGMGGNKLWYMYRKRFEGNNPMGRDSFARLIDRYGLKVRQRVRKPRTTDSRHGLPVYPNLTKRLIPELPNQLWVSDITYIPIWIDNSRNVFCYLSLILDAYTEEIIGWSVGMTLEKVYPLQALSMAMERLKGIPKRRMNLIHHSDRGSQYASLEYVRKLQKRGIRISMTESGDPKDNAKAERINNTIKNELLRGVRFCSLNDVMVTLKEKIDFYNNERPHMSLDMMTPLQATECVGEIPKKWKSRRENYIRTNDFPTITCTKMLDALPLQSQP